MIRHNCPNCGAQLEVPDQYAGQSIRCGGCGATIQCPAAPEPPSIPVAAAAAPFPDNIAPSHASPVPSDGKSQAIVCLVLALLSFVCLGPLGSIPAVILGHISLSKIRNGRMSPDAQGLAVAGLVIGYINIVIMLLFMLVMPAILLPALARAREAARRSSCQNNLKQMGLVYKMFANESKGQVFPHLSATPGQLMSAKDEIYPEYLSEAFILVCPSDTEMPARMAEPDTLVDDESYFYLGYAVESDDDVAALCRVYKDSMAQGKPLDGDLKVPDALKTTTGSVLYRLREGVERFIITDTNNPAAAAIVQSQIPVLIERPENHVPSGGNVLFLDGHVEFIRYPSQWPMTVQTINVLKELDAMGK